jgi:hypothetical protein
MNKILLQLYLLEDHFNDLTQLSAIKLLAKFNLINPIKATNYGKSIS